MTIDKKVEVKDNNLEQLCVHRGNTEWVSRPRYDCGSCLGYNRPDCKVYKGEKIYGSKL